MSLVKKLKLENNVIFLGQLPQRDLPLYLKISDVFARSSRSEGLGNSFLEAMAAGVPVIALAQGGVVETVVDGETGVLFREPTVECLVEGIKRWEDSKTGRWEQNCRKQAQKFSKERFKKELKAFVEHHLDDIRHTTYNKGI